MDFALFSLSSLFADTYDEEATETHQSFVERRHQFPAMELLIREFSFHELNSNLLWPGTLSFAEWLVQRRSWMEGRRTIELGRSQLKFTRQQDIEDMPCIWDENWNRAIFLRKSFQLDVTTSDYDDQEIADNIAHNCRVNGISPVLPHIKHSWGDAFPSADPDWDLVIASDILLYVKQYANLIKTLTYLLMSYKPKVNKAYFETSSEQNQDTCQTHPYPAFVTSWRRRIGKEDESLFFYGCEKAGLQGQHLGSRVYCITPREFTINETTRDFCNCSSSLH